MFFFSHKYNIFLFMVYCRAGYPIEIVGYSDTLTVYEPDILITLYVTEFLAD